MNVFFSIPVIFNVIQKNKKKQIKNLHQSTGFYTPYTVFNLKYQSK